jgi:hypothetical protein
MSSNALLLVRWFTFFATGLLSVSCTTATEDAEEPADDETGQVEALTAGQKVRDFLVEDVCLDGAGYATSEDPWICPERRRNRRMTDPITYVRRTPSPFSGGRGNGYPTQGPAGEFRVAFAHELGKQGFFDKSLGEGSDLLETSGVVSTVNTEDSGGGPYTPFRRYWSPGCVNEDGWSYFPTQIFKGTRTGTATRQNSVGASCNGEYQNGWYSWQFDNARNFGSAFGVARVMPAIVSRQGPDNPDRPSYFEQVEFTSLYGVTRWSAWRREDRSAASDEAARKCGLPQSQVLAGRTFTPGACNDLVQVEALPPSEWRSSLSWPINETVSGSHNTLGNGDFSDGTANGWNGVVSVARDAGSNNYGLCGPTCFAQRLINTADTRGRDQIMSGARIWTSGNADQVTVTTSVQRNNGWVIVGTAVVNVSATPALFTTTSPARNGTKVRLQFQAVNAGTQLRVDDAYASFVFPQLY